MSGVSNKKFHNKHYNKIDDLNIFKIFGNKGTQERKKQDTAVGSLGYFQDAKYWFNFTK